MWMTPKAPRDKKFYDRVNNIINLYNIFHFTPVHCSWVNRVEQWFSILQRKRFCIVDFKSKLDLKIKIDQYINEWNVTAHPFNWTKQSVTKVMDQPLMKAA